jgi:hypothetical protein
MQYVAVCDAQGSSRRPRIAPITAKNSDCRAQRFPRLSDDIDAARRHARPLNAIIVDEACCNGKDVPPETRNANARRPLMVEARALFPRGLGGSCYVLRLQKDC